MDMELQRRWAYLLFHFPELGVLSKYELRELDPSYPFDGYADGDGHLCVRSGMSAERTFLVLLHEALHLVLLHPWRGLQYPQIVRNIAADLIVNVLASELADTCHQIPFEKPDDIVKPEDFGLTSEEVLDSSLEELCERLFKDFACCSSPEGAFSRVDDHSRWDELRRNVEKGDFEAALRKLTESLKRRGTIPGDAEAVLKPEKIPPLSRLVNTVRRLLHSSAGQSYRGTRYDSLVPGRRDEVPAKERSRRGCIVVALDTSGSMWSEQSLQRAAEIVAAIRQRISRRCILIQCDAEIQLQRRRLPGRVLKVRGGGGTSHVPLFKRLEKIKPSLLVCVTDLETEFPSKAPNYPVIWVVPPDVTKKPPFGEVITWDR